MIEFFNNAENFVLLFIRLILGATMVYYGSFKIKDPKKNSKNFKKMGFKPEIIWGTLIMGVEFFGGIFIILGIFPRIFATLFAIQMITGTFWKIKTDKKFTDYSYDILLFIICATIIWFGSGFLTIIDLF